MQGQAKVRVIWRHPKGRFEVQETEHYSIFDHCTYYTRECVFTPRDDARGLCSEVPDDYVPVEMKYQGRPTPRVTPEEEAEFTEMYRCGMSARGIAKETGRAYETIVNALKRQGCAVKRLSSSVHWTHEEFQKAIAMRKRGYLLKEIGAAIGKSKNAVQNKFAREGY